MIKENGKILEGTITQNEATQNAGGGIRVDGKLILENGNITNNTANTTGGGIDWTSGVLIYQNGNIIQNKKDDIYPIFTEEKEDWSKFSSWNITPINVKLEKKYVKNKDIANYSVQGMTTTDKYLIFAQMKTEEENTKINIVDKNTYKILNTVENYCFGHANNMTYNNKNGRCYMAYKKDKKNYITSFKISDNYQLEDIQNTEVDKYYYAFAYNNDNNYFIGISGNDVYNIDENLKNSTKMFTLKANNLTKQDITYYNGKIYSICFEFGAKSKYQKKYNNREKYSNVLFTYNINGELEKTLYISNKTLAGEAEGATIENGKLLIGYNSSSWTEISFYSSEYLNETIEKDENDEKNEENKELNSNKEENKMVIKKLPFVGKKTGYIVLIIILALNIIVVKIKLKKYKNL